MTHNAGTRIQDLKLALRRHVSSCHLFTIRRLLLPFFFFFIRLLLILLIRLVSLFLALVSGILILVIVLVLVIVPVLIRIVLVVFLAPATDQSIGRSLSKSMCVRTRKMGNLAGEGQSQGKL